MELDRAAYQLFTEMYTKRVSEPTSECKKRTLDEMLGVFGEHNVLSNCFSIFYRKCVEHGCEKYSEDKTGNCIAHGGGNRCVIEGCEKYARGKINKCRKHGGGKMPPYGST